MASSKIRPEGELIAYRTAFKPPLPPVLREIRALKFVASADDLYKEHDDNQKNSLKHLFPLTYGQPMITFAKDGESAECRPLKVAVVLSGGQAPGGHTVISGIFDALQELNPQSELFGFLNGPSGLLKNQFMRLTSTVIQRYRNTGGFDMIGSGRTKIHSKEDFAGAKLTAEANDLDGLVVIGGDDSNTNMAHLAEYFKSHKCKATCVGVPKTIDGDLSNEQIEISFGFDTACKVYANEVANIARDACSARKYWFFVKMMGRSASHVTLEVASMTQPNLALISEEVAAKKMSLADITMMIADVVAERAKLGLNYGVILIPEGVVEFVPEVQELIMSLNRLLANKLHAMVLKALRKPELKTEYVMNELTGNARTCFAAMPLDIQIQLILDRDSHGNVNVSSIETEKLFGEMVKAELEQRKKKGTFKGSFDARTHFCGYQGRAAFPSNFDTKYCYALGRVAVALIRNELSGYLSCVSGLARPVEQWQPKGVPITSMMNMEERHGKMEPVIKKALVDLNSPKFKYFQSQREKWEVHDSFLWVGPMQFFGPKDLTEMANYHLRSLL